MFFYVKAVWVSIDQMVRFFSLTHNNYCCGLWGFLMWFNVIINIVHLVIYSNIILYYYDQTRTYIYWQIRPVFIITKTIINMINNPEILLVRFKFGYDIQSHDNVSAHKKLSINLFNANTIKRHSTAYVNILSLWLFVACSFSNNQK